MWSKRYMRKDVYSLLLAQVLHVLLGYARHLRNAVHNMVLCLSDRVYMSTCREKTQFRWMKGHHFPLDIAVIDWLKDVYTHCSNHLSFTKWALCFQACFKVMSEIILYFLEDVYKAEHEQSTDYAQTLSTSAWNAEYLVHRVPIRMLPRLLSVPRISFV